MGFQLMHEKRNTAYYALINYAKSQNAGNEPFTEEEFAQLQALLKEDQVAEKK